MALTLLGGSVLLLLLLIARFRINAFWALLAVSFLAGVAAGMPPGRVLGAILKGIGDTMGALVLILVFGAVLGRLIEESGAARSISSALIRLLGEKRIQLSVLITGFLVGLPMVYNASFLVLIPLIYTLSHARGLPLLYIGIPLSSALSVAHGLWFPTPPPSPSPLSFTQTRTSRSFTGSSSPYPPLFWPAPCLSGFPATFPLRLRLPCSIPQRPHLPLCRLCPSAWPPSSPRSP